jgi:MOSC domain-containing protein YiiM
MRTGFYVSVLQPGMVTAGDLLELQSRPKNPISLKFVNQAVYKLIDPVTIKRVIDSEGVVEGWKEILRARLTAS